MKKLLLFYFLLNCCFSLNAQSKQYIEDLKNGVLVVRLTSNFSKINYLKRILSKGKLSPRAAEKTAKRIHKFETEKISLGKEWMKAFSEYYDFSEVLFVFDTLSRKAIANGMQNCFLDENLNINPSIKLNNRPFLMTFASQVDSENGSGAEAIIFKNADFMPLRKPFPYYVKTVSASYIFNKIFKPSISERKNIERIVKTMNRKLTRYYNRTH